MTFAGNGFTMDVSVWMAPQMHRLPFVSHWLSSALVYLSFDLPVFVDYDDAIVCILGTIKHPI